MKEAFDLMAYLTRGVEKIVADALRATLTNPRESAYLVRFAAAAAAASKRREKQEAEGLHVPPFLIASITSSCNLHCAGCYSRCNHATVDQAPVQQMTDEAWGRVFDEAEAMGISFILLAGGEPLLRRGVIAEAGKRPNILFPVFTNGTYMDEKYFEQFDRCRNLLPVMSIEGGKEATDSRRGAGVYDKLRQNMQTLRKKGLIFGASVTVTTQNLDEVTGDKFVRSLADAGCKVVIYVEYVPVTQESRELAPGDEERERLARSMERLREAHGDLVFISFPGDEKSSGGCLAAGRGFFHINSHGDAEPCPFSPYSDISLSDGTLADALRSPLFTALRDGGLLADDHMGGCVLNDKRAEVERLLHGEG
ncbi:MAG: radical SAM protein [Clostridiales bacterium]|nr:radical SAM protein [Clostridiales bacterium]